MAFQTAYAAIHTLLASSTVGIFKNVGIYEKNNITIIK